MTDQPIESRAVDITFEKMKRASGDEPNIHNSREKAEEIGLPAPIAAGVMLQGYLSEWLFANFEDAWLETGHMNLKFIDMVFAGDTMEMTGDVTHLGDAIELDIECQVPEEDRTVIVGSATVSPNN